MARRHHNYAEISPKAQQDLITYCLLRAAGEGADFTQLVLAHLPHGSVSVAWVEEPGLISTDPNAPSWAEGDGPRVAFRIGDRNPRYCDLEAFVVLLVLTMFGGHPWIDDVSPRAQDPNLKRLHYVELLEGTRFHRLIAGGGRWEVVKLEGDHHDLRMRSLRIVPGPAVWTRESDAIQPALRLYHAAASRGQVPTLSAADYDALLRSTFKLLDDTHGHKLKRPPKPSVAAE